jgi:hypothetical protein
MEVETSNFSMLYHVSILVGDIFEHIAQVIAGETPSKLYQDLVKEISLTVCNMIEEAGSTSTKFCESIALALRSVDHSYITSSQAKADSTTARCCYYSCSAQLASLKAIALEKMTSRFKQLNAWS